MRYYRRRRQLLRLLVLHDCRCWWCHRRVWATTSETVGAWPDAATRDHVDPLSRMRGRVLRGRHALRNLVLSCEACNTRRGNEPASRWAARLVTEGDAVRSAGAYLAYPSRDLPAGLTPFINRALRDARLRAAGVPPPQRPSAVRPRREDPW